MTKILSKSKKCNVEYWKKFKILKNTMTNIPYNENFKKFADNFPKN